MSNHLVNTVDSMSGYERDYRARANRFVLYLLLGHVPVLTAFAIFQGSKVSLALFGSLLICLLPGVLVLVFPHKPGTSIALAAATMAASALLIDLGQGRIEYHFHIFSFLAVLISLCSVWALVTAAVVIAVHHVVGWLLLPSAVFSYEASLADVALHALFVVVETAICCFIARQLAQTLYSRGFLEEQVGQLAANLSNGTQDIADVLERISNLTSSQAKVLQDVAQSSARIQSKTGEDAKVAEQSRTQMQENAEQVADAFSLVTHINVEMQEVCASNRRISGIISMMNDIARQTNILAVNASIEASRSGNSGGGFGVIADQVRELAARTTAATADIEEIIQTSVDKVSASAKMLDHIRSIMHLVDHNTAKINSLIGQLTANSSARTLDTEQIAAAVQRLGRESIEVADSAQQSNDASRHLEHLAVELESSLSTLK